METMYVGPLIGFPKSVLCNAYWYLMKTVVNEDSSKP
jgi:hypothetical protein